MKYELLFCLLIFTGCASRAPKLAMVQTSHLEDQKAEFKISAGQANTLVEIHSAFGIGTGDLKLTGGKWPKLILVRLYLRGLEGFNVTAGKTTLERSQLTVEAYDKAGKPFTGGPHLMEAAGYYEVRLPDSLFAPGTTGIQIQWVDFYR